ncbi:hypothetical protein FQN54_004865 [Arachnomyces sp. PD_36]|nr:hypothetical protein FQN54_004865 [Arachnomyces sp. PD_36]
MTYSLVSPAESAESIGAGFTKFLDAVPDQATEITALVSALFALSSALRELDSACRSHQYSRNFPQIADDLRLVRENLIHTLKDAKELMGDVDHINIPSTATLGSYFMAWKRVQAFFREEYRESLCALLGRYKRFVVELTNVVKQRNDTDLDAIKKLRAHIAAVWDIQCNRVREHLGGISLGPRPHVPQVEIVEKPVAADHLNAHRRFGPTPRRSYERPRPTPVQSPQDSDSPQSPQSSTWSREGVIPPYVPEAPSSPTTTSTTTTSTSHSSTSTTTNPVVHWAMKVFEDDAAATPLPRSNERSRCYGVHMDTAKARLAEEYDELFQLSFGGGSELSVRLFRREEDHRARILCKTPSSRGSSYACLPLNNLEIVRSGSCLQICKKTKTQDELELWAALRFSTIERMVLFFCTFIALRAHDCSKPVSDIPDYELSGEVELYGGQIVDDDFLHALRIYKDKSTKAVRLQASVHRGELKRTPVWTAFITHHLLSNTWLRRVSSKTIHLSELRRTVFSPEYTPQRTPRGEHVLHFTTPEDAENFIDVLASIKSPRRR